METITLTGRNSKLSRIQIELVKAQIERAFPNVAVQIKYSSSVGDRLQNIPLQTVEGIDFFTSEVFENLFTNEADIAVHSLKDMSAEHFFGGNAFAVVDRDDVRDVAIFNASVIEKLEVGHAISIGTCSPRRELMASNFLKQALPQLSDEVKIETKIIRGNVDTRLQKLQTGEYDGIILAAAGLNRLLRSDEHAPSIQELLCDKKLMLLPIFECTPAPCQGAIVAEALQINQKAVTVLNKINKPDLFEQCNQEKKIALQYGAGCDQKFGVTTIQYANAESIFAAGVNGQGKAFDEWHNLPKLDSEGKTLWFSPETSSSITMESIQPNVNTEIAFVANANAVAETILPELHPKRIWAAGTKTWFRLAKKGLFVEGCADGLGLESLAEAWASPLLNIKKENVTVLTHQTASERWRSKGWNAMATYSCLQQNISDVSGIEHADIIFWSSAKYFDQLKHRIKPTATHVSASGETANQLKQHGLNPVVFPTIQSFQQWQKKNIHSGNAG